MTAAPTPIHSDSVAVADGVVHISDLIERGPEVVRLVADADDAAEAVHRCLRVGAVALRASSASVDIDLVERSFGGLASRLGEQVTTAVKQIDEATRGLLDADDGALHTTLTEFHTTLDDMLGKTFDPESKVSALARIEALVEEILERQADRLRKLVVIDGDDSPLARLKVEILTGVKDQVGDVTKALRDVSLHLGITEATAEVYEQGTAKGRDYESAVHDCIAGLAAQHGDAAERTGDSTGASARKVGDEVVTINRDDTLGRDLKVVFEMKARKRGMNVILDELDAAMANRDARAGVAVFRDQGVAPTSVPFHYSDDKAVAVFDPATEDDAAMRLAYMWARWVARRRASGGESEGIDHERVKRLLDDAGRALGYAKQIRSRHTTARKAIDQADDVLGKLDSGVGDALTALAYALGAEQPSDV